MVLGIDSCRWAVPRLPLLAGGELLGPDRRQVERHVLGCPTCRARLEALRSATAALRQAGRVDPLDPVEAPSLWPALALQIRESRHARRPWGRRSVTRFAAGLAAGLLLAAGSIGLWTASQLWTIDVRVTVTPKAAPEPARRLKLAASTTPADVVEDDEPSEPSRVVSRDRDRNRSAALDDRRDAVPTN